MVEGDKERGEKFFFSCRCSVVGQRRTGQLTGRKRKKSRERAKNKRREKEEQKRKKEGGGEDEEEARAKGQP